MCKTVPDHFSAEKSLPVEHLAWHLIIHVLPAFSYNSSVVYTAWHVVFIPNTVQDGRKIGRKDEQKGERNLTLHALC